MVTLLNTCSEGSIFEPQARPVTKKYQESICQPQKGIVFFQTLKLPNFQAVWPILDS